MSIGLDIRRIAVAVSAAVLVSACGADVTLPPSGSSAPAPASPTAATPTAVAPSPATLPPAPTATSVAAQWPYETIGEIADVLFAPDGRIVVLEADTVANTSRVVTLDANGAVVDGWPWSPPPTGDAIAIASFGPEGSVYVAVRGMGRVPVEWSWELHRLDAAGIEAPGFPVSLASVPSCQLREAGSGVAYAACEDPGEATGTVTSTVTAILPDGSTAPGWPVQLAGSAGIIGFRRDGAVSLAISDGQASSVAALDPGGRSLPGWPKVVKPGLETAVLDSQDRTRVTWHDWTEGQCGPAARTIYPLLGADGTAPSGWPVALEGWASDPVIADDGTMYVAQEGGLVRAYTPAGAVQPGWPARDVGVTVACYDGSHPVSAGADGVVIVGEGRVTLVQRDAKIAPGWPVSLPFQAARSCPQCVPGPAGPLAPAVGEQGVWVAAYAGDQPRMIGIDRSGSLPDTWQQAIGRPGDEIRWIRVAPTGGIWAVVEGEQGTDHARATLYQVAADRPPGG